MSATFMVVLDSTVVNVALPHIAGSLSASTDEATWTLTSYLVANAIVLPATGWLGSLLGRKRLLLGCIVIFTLASIACGVAHSLAFLIGARIVQGLGGGAMQPISQSVLLESFRPSKRGMAMAIFGLGVVVAPIIGPTLGGWITDNYSWRWVFYINLPVGVMAVLLVQTFVEDPPYIRHARAGRIDFLGLALLVLCIGSLYLMLDKGQEEDWLSSPFIRILLVTTLVTFPFLVIWELGRREPVINLRILRNRNFLTGCALITVIGAVLYGSTVLLPLFLQTLLGYPAYQSGLVMSPRGFGAMVAMFVVGRIVGVVDVRFLLILGFLALGYSIYAFGNLDLQIAPTDVIWPNVMNGLAMGFIFVPLTTSAVGTLRNEEMANATSIYNLLRNIGAAVGIAMLTTFLARGAQVHQTVLVSHMTPYDAAYQQQAQAIQSALAPQSGTYEAGQTAGAILGAQVTQQATLWAYVDNFRLLAVLAIACIPGVFLLRRLRHKEEHSAAAARD